MKIQNHSMPKHRLGELCLKLKTSILQFFIHSRTLSLSIMGAALLASAILCFTVNRYPKSSAENLYQNFSSGLPKGAISNSAALVEILSLQAELKTFLDKKQPTKSDSLRMEHIFFRIQQLNKSLKNDEKH
ncbi:hypothetical protein [Pedobacter sp. Leaf132]|uniref:hypothetical protein n=1 Tax=Pedobacter sp. Leaf132 TaxID=2876557 RepID=UPI001E5F21E8|nr:hypothetical protein [Pedobacter sp. Leaf132]